MEVLAGVGGTTGVAVCCRISESVQVQQMGLVSFKQREISSLGKVSRIFYEGQSDSASKDQESKLGGAKPIFRG